MDIINHNLEMFEAANDVEEIEKGIAESSEVINTLRFVKKHIDAFGINENNLPILNENGQLSEILDIPEEQISSTEVTVVQEGLIDKIRELGSKLSGFIKSKFSKKKEQMVNQQEKVKDVMTEMVESVEDLEKALKEKNFELDWSSITTDMDAKKTITSLENMLALEKLFGSSIIKTNSNKIMWWDFTSIQSKAKSLGNLSFKVTTKKFGMNLYDSKTSDGEAPNNTVKESKSSKELGWSKETLQKVIDILKKGYDQLYTKNEAMQNVIKVYENNIKIIDQADSTGDDKVVQDTFDEVEVADKSNSIVDHILINMDLSFCGVAKGIVHAFMPKGK